MEVFREVLIETTFWTADCIFIGCCFHTYEWLQSIAEGHIAGRLFVASCQVSITTADI